MEVTEKNIGYIRKNAGILQKKLQEKESKTEAHFADLLDKAGIYYVREKANYRVGTRWCYYDFFIPGCGLYVELDGREHKLLAQRTVDYEKTEIVRNKFLRLVRFTNSEVLSLDSISLYDMASRITTRNNIRNVKEWSIKQREKYNNGRTRAIQKFGELICKAPIYLYNMESDKFYEFESIYDANNATGVTIEKIVKEKEVGAYKNIKFLWAPTKDVCVELATSNLSNGKLNSNFITIHSIASQLKDITMMEKGRKHNKRQISQIRAS